MLLAASKVRAAAMLSSKQGDRRRLHATDTDQSSGQFGLKVFRGTGVFQHLNLS
ncbi:hypothetical protein [Streptomyces sp. SID13031]|uniref:hypothetical protein n=1 Tax=Streptomyces sp. SID13031 TaxID=2706046 RepID=UPI0013C61986|nr:hypothetical protein [Streptomyces sp. SID13031]NEA33543.1 hypothetical protein [Streptomyces sp. SID13031]